MNVIQTILDYNKSKESGGKTDITKSDIISALGYTPISELEKGANSGIAELDDNGKVLTSELPSYVDDVEEFNNLVELQKHTGEASKIYITLDDNKCYRWGGTAYVEISSSITLGETSGTAFRGDLGKEAYDKSHTHSNKEVIDSITSEDITNWNNKSDFDGKYTSLTDTPTIPTVTNDLTNELKANYDLAYTQTHTHSNKELLDKLSLNKDNKLLYNGDKVDSDVDLTAIIDDSTIADKTTWSSNKINTTIPKTWVGTKADYEQIKDTLENGTIVYITDDESVILLDKTEITKMKLTDEEFKRQINTLYDINNGSALSIETDSDTAYAKTVPTGAKLMSVKNIGGKSLVWNQLVKTNTDFSNTITDTRTFFMLKFMTFDSNGTIKEEKTLIWGSNEIKSGKNSFIFKIAADGNTVSIGHNGETRDIRIYENATTQTIANHTYYLSINIKSADPTTVGGLQCNNLMLIDLTAMFGSGNEPSTVEEFEKIFPADYYPYNAGEIVSAGVTEVTVGDTAHQIPEAIRNLPGYGWSAGTARNYVDYENKKYYQCVKSVDLGALNWSVGGGSLKTVFIAVSPEVSGQKLSNNSDIAANILCSKYLAKSQNEVWFDATTVGIATNATIDEYVYVTDTAYTDATTFKQAMSGVILYYELAEPIVTDISSLIPDDFLRNIEVEAGGSITFKNSNGDSYHISVPSELSYTVKFNSNASKEYVDSELAKKANKTDITNTLSSYAKKTDIPTKLPANGGNADTVNNHTVLSDVPASAKFTDTITPIEDSSTTSTTSTWSAQKINATITNNKNARVILSMGRDIVEAETKTSELVSLDGAYLYWSSQAGTNNYVFGIILYVYNKWTMIPIAQSSDNASTGISFSITDNTITMTKHNTSSTPTAGGVFALGPTLI